jgi:hypothetical protein
MDELKQVVPPAGLGAGAGEAIAAEGLPIHERAGYAPVEWSVASSIAMVIFALVFYREDTRGADCSAPSLYTQG